MFSNSEYKNEGYLSNEDQNSQDEVLECFNDTLADLLLLISDYIPHKDHCMIVDNIAKLDRMLIFREISKTVISNNEYIKNRELGVVIDNLTSIFGGFLDAKYINILNKEIKIVDQRVSDRYFDCFTELLDYAMFFVEKNWL